MNLNLSFVKPVVFGARLATRWKTHTLPQNAVWIKKELVHMGPAYVKIGQLVATRNDLFPKAIVTELSSLHDNVPPCPYDEIKAVVEYELQSNLADVFSEFSTCALNSASIGQVHTARLPEYPTTPLVVKVQRPHIQQQFANDFDSIVFFAKCMVLLAPENRELDDLYKVIVQTRGMIEEELDFTNEYENLNALRRVFATDEHIVVPRTIKHLSTRRVLVMECVESTRLSESPDPEKVTRQLVKSVVTGGLRHGLIHGDLHPGNIGLVADNKMVLYDGGLVLSVDKTVVRNVFAAVLTEDVELLAKTLVSHRWVYIDDATTGTAQLKQVCRYVFEYVHHLDVKRFIGQIAADPLLNSGRLAFHVDSQLFLMSRSITLLEGTCKTVDGSFSYTDVILNMLTDMSIVMDYVDMDVLIAKSMTDIQKLLLPTKTTDTD